MHSSRAPYRRRTAATLAAATVVATLVGTAGPMGQAEAKPGKNRPCDRAWQLLDAPTPPDNNFEAIAVEALAPDNVLFSSTTGGNTMVYTPWLLRWDGSSVEPADEPFPGSPAVFSEVMDASFDSPEHGWVVAADGFGRLFPYTARWQDGRWTRVPVDTAPDPEATLQRLEGITSLTPDDAWAVGILWHDIFVDGALIQHWNGTRWQVVPNPMQQTAGASLAAVDGVSPTDAWAVGRKVVEGTGVPLVQRWDGAAWREVDLPPVAEGTLTAVTATSATDVWATGFFGTDQAAENSRPLVMHYDGTEWTVADLPELGASNTSSVYAASPSDVWVTVRRFGADGFLHWDGTDWTFVSWPGGNDAGRSLNIVDIDGTGSGDIWAIASDWAYVNPQEPIRVGVAHYGCQGRGR